MPVMKMLSLIHIFFNRESKKIRLTDEGILFKHRALEILALEEKTLEELKGQEELIEGSVTIGCGEFASVESLADICEVFQKKYPKVQICLHTATADVVYDRMLSLIHIYFIFIDRCGCV